MDPNIQAPVDTANKQRAATPGFLAGQNAETSDFLTRFRSLLGGQESTTAMASRLGEGLNLPTLQKNAQTMQQTLADIPQTYSAATRGFDVNANQLSRIIGQKTTELAPSAQRAQDQADFAQNQVSTLLGYGQRDQDRQLIPFQTEQSLLSDRLARETTLYTQDNQHELDAIISKMNAGITLSEAEKNRAQELSIAEKNFENAKALNVQQAQLTGKDNRYITLSDGATLYDTLTGKVVSENNKNFAGTGGGINISQYRDPTSTQSVQPTSTFRKTG